MEYNFADGDDVWHYETREQELHARGPEIELHLPWREITGAGGNSSGKILVATDRVFYLSAGRGGEERERFVADLETHLGEKWQGDGIRDFRLRKRLGYATWWVCPVTILFTLLIGAVLVGALGIVGMVSGLIEDYFWVLLILGFVYLLARWMKNIRS